MVSKVSQSFQCSMCLKNSEKRTAMIYDKSLDVKISLCSAECLQNYCAGEILPKLVYLKNKPIDDDEIDIQIEDVKKEK